MHQVETLSSVVASNATVVRRRGRWLSVKLAVKSLTPESAPEVLTAIDTLIRSGVEVRVLEGDVSYRLQLVGETVMWNQRQSRKTRKRVTVKVALA